MAQRYRARNYRFSTGKTGKERWLVHSWQKGDSLYRLAETYKTSVLQIIRDNPTLDPRSLTLGQRIFIRH